VGKSPAATGSIALVDIGSNAVRCVLARLDARPGVEITFRERVQTRLGASSSDELPPAAIQATLRVARRFLKRVRRDHARARVLAVATAAVRDASNREALLKPLGALGVNEIRILSGSEEGRLGAEAALRASPLERGMVVDLGGGSLQLTPIEAGAILASQSAPIGVARMLRRFSASDPAQPDELVALRAELRSQLQQLLQRVPAGGRALVSGGVVNAIARAALARRDAAADPGKLQTHGCVLDTAEISALRAWLEPMTVQHRAHARGVKPDRADVIVVGAIVLEELLASSRYAALTVSRTSVREAVLWREAEKLAT
jgi:exopolyphosphatase/guanosine-5'-triphosphate,3'-diphosphate pyrophosphatase